jgi:hypothetical protein
MSQPEVAESANKKHPTLSIVIDSKPYTVRDETWQADALLRLAGLDPAEYDLTTVKNGEIHRYKDDHVIEVHNGEEFESVRQDGPVA